VLRLGRWRLHAILDGTLALDGGSLFGIVPRPRWEKLLPPDARGRVTLALRCLLAVDEESDRRILVDTGMGDLPAPPSGATGTPRPPAGLQAGLAACGLTAADVTDVVLTHLHLDHAGGLVRWGAGGRPEAAFPRATVHVQRGNWAWAHAPSDHDASSFRPEPLELLAHSSHLHLVEGERELLPGLDLVVSEGHTTAQQLPRFHGEGRHLTCCADVIPTTAHLKPAWGMAFDLRPLTTVEEKKVLLAEALEADGILFFSHDPAVAACRLAEVDGRPGFREAVEV
jgi:glyoxylase-like metal-dependent hydrolase (beta-lactamase superfamily II)